MRVGAIERGVRSLRTAGEAGREWVLFSGHRLAVSAVGLLAVAAVAFGIVVSGLAPLEAETPILFLVFALISGNFVLISIVVSLNQFVLTRHLESPDEIRSRMDEMMGYRRAVGESSRRDVLPITQTGFLAVLFQTIDEHVRDIRREIPETADEMAQDELWTLTAGLEAHCARVSELLEGTAGDPRQALFEMVNESYASYIYLAYHLESEHAETISDAVTDRLTGLNRTLEQVDVARRFFKTVFIQSELASLSRLLLYIGIPVQLLSMVLMLAFTTPPGTPLSPAVLEVVVPVILVLGFTPIVILTAYIVRLSTVAQRTAAMYPFTSEPNGLGDLPDTHLRGDGLEGDGEAGAAGSWSGRRE